jgi:phosphopantothenoylcysteine decarboxylase / phosphopantothenate---cysteine ligase
LDVSTFQPRVLITAGPTHEPIDAVRYLANRSSGRMGLALTEAAVARGWPTTLLLGPTHLQPPESSHLETIRFQTTADLQRLLREHWPQHDLLLMAAAVADYTPVSRQDPHGDSGPPPAGKIKRSDQPLHLELRPTPDLLAQLAAITRPDQRVVGFALEPSDRLLDSAREKLKRKRLDAIIANPLETMDAPDITASVIFPDGRCVDAPPNLAKREFAQWLLSVLPSWAGLGEP